VKTKPVKTPKGGEWWVVLLKGQKEVVQLTLNDDRCRFYRAGYAEGVRADLDDPDVVWIRKVFL